MRFTLYSNINGKAGIWADVHNANSFDAAISDTFGGLECDNQECPAIFKKVTYIDGNPYVDGMRVYPNKEALLADYPDITFGV